MMDIKKVACLYRVSTKMQVSVDDDLPVQRNACLEFISKHSDWEFAAEYLEKDVSGYKRHWPKRMFYGKYGQMQRSTYLR